MGLGVPSEPAPAPAPHFPLPSWFPPLSTTSLWGVLGSDPDTLGGCFWLGSEASIGEATYTVALVPLSVHLAEL